MGYPSDDTFRAAMENRAPPRQCCELCSEQRSCGQYCAKHHEAVCVRHERPVDQGPARKRSEVTSDRRVQQLTEKLYGVDFGVNMDGYSRARIAQVIVAMVEADREAIAADMERVAAATTAPEDHRWAAEVSRASTILETAEGIKNRYPMPDVTTEALWAAAQPNKDWVL